MRFYRCRASSVSADCRACAVPLLYGYRVEKVHAAVVDEFYDELAEERILPCEPCAGEVGGVVHIERLVHESRAGVGRHEHLDAVFDLLVVIARKGLHHDAHGPCHVISDVGAADALARLAAEEVGVAVAPDEAARVGIYPVVDNLGRKVFQGQQAL